MLYCAAPMQDPAQDPKSFPPPWNYLIPLARRTLIWGSFFLIIYLLRHFLPLVFLTFVFAYMADHGVVGLAHRIRSRKARTGLVFVTMIGVIGLVVAYIGPELKNQAVVFAGNLEKHESAVDRFLDRQRARSPFMKGVLGEIRAKNIVGELMGRQKAESDSEQFHQTMQLVVGVFRDAASVTTTFLLSLLFAFLIVVDLPRIGRGMQSLKDTRLHHFYDEVSRTVFRFAQVLGHFLEAQLVIATINTALTAIGMAILGVPQVWFLAGVVFICSFVPVAGVFISSFPICLVALDHAGISLVLWIAVMVSIVHAIEAYVLNPMIFGAHLHMNPVLVLAVLLIGHQRFGIWGLLLGVPTVTYIFGYAIRYDTGVQPEP